MRSAELDSASLTHHLLALKLVLSRASVALDSNAAIIHQNNQDARLVHFEPVQKQDFDHIFSIVKQGIYSHVDAVFGWSDEFQRSRLNNEYEPHWFYWIHEKNERVGMICFKADDDAIHVHFLILFPQFQNKNLGTQAMKQIHALASEEGKYRITLSSFSCNEPAIRFYKKLGYQVVDGDKHFLFMSLRLPR